VLLPYNEVEVKELGVLERPTQNLPSVMSHGEQRKELAHSRGGPERMFQPTSVFRRRSPSNEPRVLQQLATTGSVGQGHAALDCTLQRKASRLPSRRVDTAPQRPTCVSSNAGQVRAEPSSRTAAIEASDVLVGDRGIDGVHFTRSGLLSSVAAQSLRERYCQFHLAPS
jgi:hypothetical protein